MVGARRFVLACLLGAGAAGLAAPRSVHAAGCEAILGKWTWFTGGVVSINADGTIVHDPGNDGTWECTDSKGSRVTLRWRVGGYVNRLALSADGKGLASTDPAQSFVTAKRVAPSRPAPRTAEAPRPAPSQPAPRTAEPARPAPSQPAPRAEEAPRPAPAQPPSTPPSAPAPPRSGPAPEGAGPCSGNACVSVKVFTEAGCVWLRNSSPAVLNVEVRLEKETVKMVLEGGDLAKAGPSTDIRTTRRSGAGLAKTASAQSRHKATYDALSGSNRAVYEARVGTPAGCVVKPEAIVGYKASFASAEAAKAFSFGSEPESVPCSGDACRDLDHRVEEIKACRLTNTGRREIKVGVVTKGNREPSMSTSVEPTKTMRLQSFAGCLRVSDIERIEASYK
jgi:hypothetical protein